MGTGPWGPPLLRNAERQTPGLSTAGCGRCASPRHAGPALCPWSAAPAPGSAPCSSTLPQVTRAACRKRRWPPAWRRGRALGQGHGRGTGCRISGEGAGDCAGKERRPAREGNGGLRRRHARRSHRGKPGHPSRPHVHTAAPAFYAPPTFRARPEGRSPAARSQVAAHLGGSSELHEGHRVEVTAAWGQIRPLHVQREQLQSPLGLRRGAPGRCGHGPHGARAR